MLARTTKPVNSVEAAQGAGSASRPAEPGPSGLICHPTEVAEWSRRTLLKSGVSLAAWLSMDKVFSFGNARAQDALSPTGPARRLIWIEMRGGWDILETVDPKPVSTAGIDVAFNWSLAQNLGSAGESVKVGRWLPGIASRGDQIVLVRGLAMGTTSHDAGRVYMDTGILSNNGQVNAASIPSIIASESQATIPIIQLNGGAEPQIDRGLLKPVSVVRAENLQLYQSMYPSGDAETQRSLRILDYMRSSVERIRNAVGANDRLTDIEAAEDKIRNQISSGIAQQLELTEEDRAPYLTQGNRGGDAFALAEKLLRNDLVTTINMGVGGFDTHAMQDRSLQPILAGFDTSLSTFIDRLQATGQLDSTLIVVYSDFGRTPKINNRSGRDHWPVGGAMLIGGGLLGGRAVGATDDNMLGLDVDPESGSVVGSGGTQLNPTHLGGAVVELTLGAGYLSARPYLSSIPALVRTR
jgi:hypothetical protein